jgi:carbonic anhydrase/acetyltransferase-like protein (isoleucine patch superfamily)
VLDDFGVLGRRSVLGDGVSLGTGAFVAADVVVGAGTTAGANLTLGYGAVVGADVRFEFDDIVVGNLVHIDDGAVIHTGAHVGRDARVHAGATVDLGATVGAGATLGTGAVLGEFSRLSSGAVIGGGSVLGDRVVIGRDVTTGVQVSIGSDSVVRAGASIGQYATLAPNSRVPRGEVVPEGPPPAPPATTLTLGYAAIKQVTLSWTASPSATFYRVFESHDGVAPFTQLGGDLTTLSSSATVPLHLRGQARYKVAACNASGCTDSPSVAVTGYLVPSIGYFKPSNMDAGDEFGRRLALSDDGNTLVVGAPFEDSGALGVNGGQANNTSDAGAAYVFVRSGSTWVQQAYLKASNTGAGDNFGDAVTISADGNTVVVGARGEDSNAGGIGTSGLTNNFDGSGAVYVFQRTGTTWAQQAFIKADLPGPGDSFGTVVALSDSGDRLLVGAPNEDNDGVGVNGFLNDNDNTPNSGAAYLFQRTGTTWAQAVYFKASNANGGDNFGTAVALSGDGATAVISSKFERSNATQVNGDQGDNSLLNAGAVYVYARPGATWVQQAYLKAHNTEAGDQFGGGVATSGDGSTVAVFAENEDGCGVGVGANGADNGCTDSGAVYLYQRTGVTWSFLTYVKASHSPSSEFGRGLAVSGDGLLLASGDFRVSGSTQGVNGPYDNNGSFGESGEVDVYRRDSEVWSHASHVKASNTGNGDMFGFSVSLSADGSTMAVGARNEMSNAATVGGDQTNNSLSSAGAAYLY